MAISKEAYTVMKSIVGSQYISDDPAICEGYRCGPGGYECGLGYERVMTKIPVRSSFSNDRGGPGHREGL